MTTLILAQKKVLSFRWVRNIQDAVAWFEEINRKGLITFALIFGIGISVLGYLASLYLVFNLGFEIQGETRTLMELKNIVTATDLTVQRSHNHLAEDHKDIIESMVDISAIRYLAPAEKSFAASEVLNPGP